MPVEKCEIYGESGYRWGKTGKCYTGEGARERALAQGKAIEASEDMTKENIDHLPQHILQGTQHTLQKHIKRVEHTDEGITVVFAHDTEHSEDPPTDEVMKAKLTFVVGCASKVEKEQGALLVGDAGQTFDAIYLAPLGLTRDDVLVVKVTEATDIDTPVVALGKMAQEVLPHVLALPHPEAVTRGTDADKARCLRKVLGLRQAVFTHTDVTIKKAQDALQIVEGVVLDPYIIDSDNDWITPDEIEKTAYRYMESSRVVCFRHKSIARATVVSSFVVPYPSPRERELAILGKDHTAWEYPYGQDIVHSGAWILGVRLSDDLWRDHLAGNLNSFSIGGTGTRNKVDKSDRPVVQFARLSPPRD